jgi:hypothetical protein
MSEVGQLLDIQGQSKGVSELTCRYLTTAYQLGVAMMVAGTLWFDEAAIESQESPG